MKDKNSVRGQTTVQNLREKKPRRDDMHCVCRINFERAVRNVSGQFEDEQCRVGWNT